MSGRRLLSAKAKYGYQGQEKDEELWDGAISFKYRIEDPRLGRFFSVDPMYPEYPWNSPYAFSENRVMDGMELEGLEVVLLNDNSSGQYAGEKQTDKTAIHVTSHGNPQELINNKTKKSKDKYISTPEQFDKMLSEESSEWKNRVPGQKMVVVLHSCGTGRDYKYKKGDKKGQTTNLAQKLSKAFPDVIFVAPDERIQVVQNKNEGPTSGIEVGVKKSVFTDENADYIEDKNGAEMNKNHTFSKEFGKWNVYEGGQKVNEYKGNEKMTGEKVKADLEEKK